MSIDGRGTILGLSNISFGLDPYPRQILNSVYMAEAIKNGLDAAIVHASKIVPMHKLEDADREVTLDLIYEMERRNLFGFLVPSVFTPLEGTRMEEGQGVARTQDLTPLQWQLIMQCWQMNMRPGLQSWWGPLSYRVGSLLLWAFKLRKTNGPNFTWPLFNFAGAMPRKWMVKMGKVYGGTPLKVLTRKELLATIRPAYWKYLREDNGDMPEMAPPPPKATDEPIHAAM